VIDRKVDGVLKGVCIEIERRYQLKFLEIETDSDHVHFLVQSAPAYSVTKIVTMLKSITARAIIQRMTTVKKQLWDGVFWSDGCFSSAVGMYEDEEVIEWYVRHQGKEYENLHADYQLALF